MAFDSIFAYQHDITAQFNLGVYYGSNKKKMVFD